MFKRKKEDFVCEHCGEYVVGNGDTNHCPLCLYSKHVDIEPGDRLAECGGLMKPVSVEKKKDEYVLIHKCSVCGHVKKNKMQEGDDFDVVLKIVEKGIEA